MNWALLIDIGVLGLLGATIFYAARLSTYMKTFHEGKQDMGYLIQDLSSSVTRAENAIHAMQESAAKSGQKLQDVINEAKFISDELRFMGETGNSLADRLEKLADRNRELVEEIQHAGGYGHASHDYTDIPNDLRLKTIQSALPKKKSTHLPSTDRAAPANEDVQREIHRENAFFIRDIDFDEEDMDLDDDLSFEDEDDFMDDDAFSFANVMNDAQDDEEDNDVSFKSQAEQELFMALRRRKRGSASQSGQSSRSSQSTQSRRDTQKILGDVS